MARFEPDMQPMSDINMTPLIDVMLVLVVILIITAPLMASSLRLDLPKTEAATTNDTRLTITVAVNAEGQVFMVNQPLTLQELAHRLVVAHRSNPDAELQLRADKSVPYGRIVAIIGLAHQAGLNRIGFVAEHAPQP